MKKTDIKYIKKIEIEGLWHYKDYNISWNLHPDVNIIAGDNGSGKSTVLDAILSLIRKEKIPFLDRIKVTFDDDNFLEYTPTSGIFDSFTNLAFLQETFINFILLKTFDLPLQHEEAIKQITNEEVKTTLDLILWRLLNDDYKNHQIEIGKRIINALKNKEENIEKINAKMDLFIQIIDESFAHTKKRIDKNENRLSFIGRENRKISPYMLSSGEKQLLIMLLQTLIQDETHCIMLLDEPELSLHTDWQERLISNIRKLNPNVQLIIATHSPSIVAEGWENKVFEIPNF